MFFLFHVIDYLGLYCYYDTAQAFGMPFLSPYLQSINPNFKHGANFATLASTVLLPTTSLFVSGISPFSLAIQLNQMLYFKAKVVQLHQKGMYMLDQNTSYQQGAAHGLRIDDPGFLFMPIFHLGQLNANSPFWLSPFSHHPPTNGYDHSLFNIGPAVMHAWGQCRM